MRQIGGMVQLPVGRALRILVGCCAVLLLFYAGVRLLPRATSRPAQTVVALPQVAIASALRPAPGLAALAGKDAGQDDVARVFDSEIFLPLDNKKYVSKWKNDVHIGVTGGASPRMFEYLTRAVADVQEATHHPMTFTSDNVDFLVILSDHIQQATELNAERVRSFFPYPGTYDEFMRRFKQEDWPCAEKIVVSSTMEIQGYVMMVSTAKGQDTFETCVNRGLMRGVGFEGHLGEAVARWTEKNTAAYKRYLALLYDDRLRIGEPADAAAAEIATILQK